MKLNALQLHILLWILGSLPIHSCVEKPYATGPDIYVKDSNFKIVGYLSAGGFENIDNLQLTELTYLNLAFANPDSDGELVFSGNADIMPVVKKGHDAGLRVFISLAGGGKPDVGIWSSVVKPKTHFY